MHGPWNSYKPQLLSSGVETRFVVVVVVLFPVFHLKLQLRGHGKNGSTLTSPFPLTTGKQSSVYSTH